MGKKVLLALLLLVMVGCASVAPNPGESPPKLVATASKAVSTLTWIKAVTDPVFAVGCSSGQFNPSLCSSYEVASELAKVSIDTTKLALANYEKTGDPLNEELLISAMKGLSPYILRFDLFYKHPETSPS